MKVRRLSLAVLISAVMASGCGGTTTTTVTESAASPTGCVNVSTGEPADCDEPGAVEQAVYDEHNDTSTPASSTTTTDTAETGPPDCSEYRRTGKEGKCQLNGRKYKVVNRDSTLDLEELSVQIVGIERADALTDVGTEVPNGVYLVFSLAVTNKLSKPVQFDPAQEQVAYTANGDTYTQDFDAENGGDESSFLWQAEDIQPGTTQQGTVIFDVPEKAADALDKDGNLAVFNFSDSDGFGGGKPEMTGIIRTYGP